ncbi:hypothetical protein N7530_001507 [Penicillium desertorum]|uniref:Uncharacterized protein n=1 Tax=Penicillium desertorum TaxID=1303715 RepID=A0A9W9XAD7_9EURO|nr:hypothetical protein N7530_001507 [Penicillium desertorum]
MVTKRQRRAVLSSILREYFEAQDDPFPPERDVAVEVKRWTAVQRYGRGFPNIPPCALGVDISHLSAGLLMFLRAGKTGEDFRTTAWDMAHGVGRDPPSPRMIPKHFSKPGGPVAEASGAGTEFTDMRSEGPEALDALPDDDNSAPGTNQTRVQVGFVEFPNTFINVIQYPGIQRAVLNTNGETVEENFRVIW